MEDWYAVQFRVESALKVSDSILDTIERLEMHPNSGSLTPDAWMNQQGDRMITCHKHIAVYKQVGEMVYVYYIADTQTEYTKLFF